MFPSDRIPKATKDVKVRFFIHSSKSCKLYQRIPGTVWSYYVRIYESESNEALKYFYLVIYWTQNVHNDLIFLCSLHSFTVTRRFFFTMASTAAMTSGVTTRCAWPGGGESVTELMPFMNSLVHSYTCCSDRHASPYWTFIRRWISMGFTSSLLKKTDDRTLFFFAACYKPGRHFYTTTEPSCCIPESYCHLSATLRTMSNIVVNLQANRAVFRIFIAFWRFSFESPSYVCVCVCVYVYIYIYLQHIYMGKQ